MRLTAIIPLLGVVLIFNETTAKSLVLYPEFLNDIGQSANGSFSLSTLYFTYFGLCALGIGSIIFSLACPSDVQNQSNQLEFVVSTPIGESKNLAKSYLRYVVQAFANANDRDMHSADSLSYPASLNGEMHGLLGEIYTAANFDEDNDLAETGDASDVDDWPDFMEVMNGAGYLDYTKFGIAMANEIRVMWAFTMPFYDQAPTFARDIAYIKYRTDDLSRFSFRVLTATLYVFGLLLLSVPTAQTFYFLARSVLLRIL